MSCIYICGLNSAAFFIQILHPFVNCVCFLLYCGEWEEEGVRDKEMKGCATEKRKGRNIVRERQTGDEMKKEKRERAGQKGGKVEKKKVDT